MCKYFLCLILAIHPIIISDKWQKGSGIFQRLTSSPPSHSCFSFYFSVPCDNENQPRPTSAVKRTISSLEGPTSKRPRLEEDLVSALMNQETVNLCRQLIQQETEILHLKSKLGVDKKLFKEYRAVQDVMRNLLSNTITLPNVDADRFANIFNDQTMLETAKYVESAVAGCD